MLLSIPDHLHFQTSIFLWYDILKFCRKMKIMNLSSSLIISSLSYHYIYKTGERRKILWVQATSKAYSCKHHQIMKLCCDYLRLQENDRAHDKSNRYMIIVLFLCISLLFFIFSDLLETLLKGDWIGTKWEEHLKYFHINGTFKYL